MVVVGSRCQVRNSVSGPGRAGVAGSAARAVTNGAAASAAAPEAEAPRKERRVRGMCVRLEERSGGVGKAGRQGGRQSYGCTRLLKWPFTGFRISPPAFIPPAQRAAAPGICRGPRHEKSAVVPLL